MKSSILTDVKTAIGIPPDEIHFDSDICMHINTALFTLMQVGVVKEDSNPVVDDRLGWEDLVEGPMLHSIKTYVFLSTKLLFDPPTSGSNIMEHMNSSMNEILWRLMVEKEKPKK